MAAVASRTVAKITHDGMRRASIVGNTKSRAAILEAPRTLIRWAIVDFVAARLSSQSVLPKLCKRHLQFYLRNFLFRRARDICLPSQRQRISTKASPL